MSCTGTAPNNIIKLRTGEFTFTDSESDKKFICESEKVLSKIYNDFTKDISAVNISTQLTSANILSTTDLTTPGSFLKILPSSSTIRDLFYQIDALDSDQANNIIKTQMKNILLQNVKTVPTSTTPNSPPSVPTDFSTPDNFNGIYGLINAINLLKSKINTTIVTKSQSGVGSGGDFTIDSETGQRLNYITTFYDKKDTKDTLEEISSRENEIYREKFLYIILMIVGVIAVGRQLTQRYFSNVDFMGSGGLFSGFSIGQLFNRDSSSLSGLFSNNAYSLKSR